MLRAADETEINSQLEGTFRILESVQITAGYIMWLFDLLILEVTLLFLYVME